MNISQVSERHSNKFASSLGSLVQRMAGALLLALGLVLLLGCSRVSGGPEFVPVNATDESIPNSPLIPLSSQDAHWGEPSAPVTLVAFLDFECPFCSKVHETLEEIKHHYGPKKLRVAIKHNPLAFHPRAVAAAKAAQAVRVAAGSSAFFSYTAQLFDNPRELTDANLRDWAEDSVPESRFLKLIHSEEVNRKVRLDQHLASQLGVDGVPAFFINGASLVGARPIEHFEAIINHELKATEVALAAGTQPQDIYQSRVETNFKIPEGSQALRVPIAGSPTLGPQDAPVTLVEFADFECPYCARVHRTVQELMRRYPGQIRWVFKQAPLPNHRYAVPAALLTIVTRQEKGDAAFWQMTNALMSEPQLNADALIGLAQEFKVSEQGLRKAQMLGVDHPRLQQDADLAMDLEARGTPHFFVNGKRLAGAQPIEEFVEAVELELAHAHHLLKQGVAKEQLYAHMQQQALPPPGLRKLEVEPVIPGAAPSRGPADAPVVLQVFSDFECPFCERVMPTLDALEQQFPTQLRIVWRNLPLNFHRGALPAAQAATEVWKQQGDAGFWEYARQLFKTESERSLTADSLAQIAEQQGVAPNAVLGAIEQGKHSALIRRDVALATRLELNGTPAFMINGYPLKGAQPLRRFERLIRQALEDVRQQQPSKQ